MRFEGVARYDAGSSASVVKCNRQKRGASLESYGNLFGIEETTGRVLVEDHNYGGVYELASSFEKFLLQGVWK